MTTVFLLGATGFLGGTVLSALSRHHDPQLDVTCLVRPGKEGKVAKSGCKVVVGDFSELEKIQELSARHDVVINAATSDDLDLTKAINRGLAKGILAGTSRGVLVHVSGTRLIESAGMTGNYEDAPKYDDDQLDQIKGIPDSALHRYIDLEVERADLASEIIASTICPGVIFGVGQGPGKTVSDLVPDMVRCALKAGHAVYAGDGQNEWPEVHVEDVADLVLLSMKHNLETSKPAGFERFYFAENGSHRKLDHTKDIARILSAHGRISSDVPVSVSADAPGAPAEANRTTSRCVANRSRRELGWKPKYTMADTLEEDILNILASEKA